MWDESKEIIDEAYFHQHHLKLELEVGRDSTQIMLRSSEFDIDTPDDEGLTPARRHNRRVGTAAVACL